MTVKYINLVSLAHTKHALGRGVIIPVACYPCLSSSKHQASCNENGVLDLKKKRGVAFYNNRPRGHVPWGLALMKLWRVLQHHVSYLWLAPPVFEVASTEQCTG